MTLCFIIPTRNRPQLAITAVRALLAQQDVQLTVVVSDNSSREDDLRLLRDLCDAVGDPRLLYIRPDAEMSMAAHWNWAVEQALARTTATHFGVHYDRKIMRPGGAATLARSCARHDGLLVRYGCDFVYNHRGKFTARFLPATGKEYAIRTERVIGMTVDGVLEYMGDVWPLLMNCMVPRAVLERLRARFGSICDSTTPDAAFCYRFCAVAGQYVFLDRALVVMYAYQFSQGQAYFRGDLQAGYGDFMKLWGDRPWIDAAPIPGLDLGMNMIFHEYGVVRDAAGFPELDREGYLRELARCLTFIADPRMQAGARAVLEQHGWREEPPPPPPPLWCRAVRRARSALRAARNPRFRSEAKVIEYLLTHEPPPAARNPLLDGFDAVPVQAG